MRKFSIAFALYIAVILHGDFIYGADAFSAESSGRRTTNIRTRAIRSPQRQNRSSNGADNSQSNGPKSRSSRGQRPPRRSGQQQDLMLFDPKKITSEQSPNEHADELDLNNPEYKKDPTFIKRRSPSSVVQISSNADVIVSEDDTVDTSSKDDECKGPEIAHNHFEQISFDECFPGLNFSSIFFSNGEFRQSIRVAMRKDIFYTTPAYADLSPKVAAIMLDDDSSLQGTWNCVPRSVPEELKNSLPPRMTRLSAVLSRFLGRDAPTGDEFMMTIGALCGKDPTSHWIDIIGVKDRMVSHSWHQDTGRSYQGDNINEKSRFTVMLGFPMEDEYCGCGVFSHAIKLKHEHLAPAGHNDNEPVLFEGTAGEDFIIRPEFAKGREILRYRDVDVLHSAPDYVYRQSVMRFM